MAEVRHGDSPMVVSETAGKKAYCMCGHSAKLPYCDGAHSREGTGVGPCVVDVDADGKKAVCQCHRSGNLPWCDGTHSKPV
ncbi:MAG: CDGSH iron-sulfur domain-containing protein [Planctomycetota bacterium]|jgi:CDGSH-type Zn-finger protein